MTDTRRNCHKYRTPEGTTYAAKIASIIAARNELNQRESYQIELIRAAFEDMVHGLGAAGSLELVGFLGMFLANGGRRV